jgi:hypothetical protein
MAGVILEIPSHTDATAAYAVRISRRIVDANIAANNGVSCSGFQIEIAFSSLYIDRKAACRQKISGSPSNRRIMRCGAYLEVPTPAVLSPHHLEVLQEVDPQYLLSS